MRGLLVLCGSLRTAINLDQEETGGILGVLEDIEAGDTRLKDTLPRVIKAGGDEGIDNPRQDPDLNVHDNHVSSFARRGGDGNAFLHSVSIPLSVTPEAAKSPPRFVFGTVKGVRSPKQESLAATNHSRPRL